MYSLDKVNFGINFSLFAHNNIKIDDLPIDIYHLKNLVEFYVLTLFNYRMKINLICINCHNQKDYHVYWIFCDQKLVLSNI